MRKLVAFAVLFLCSSAVQAQDPTTQERVEPPASAVGRSAPAHEAPASSVDLNPRNATDARIESATLRAPADADEASQDITAPRNFWWLVGAIVLAGVILAVLL